MDKNKYIENLSYYYILETYLNNKQYIDPRIEDGDYSLSKYKTKYNSGNPELYNKLVDDVNKFISIKNNNNIYPINLIGEYRILENYKNLYNPKDILEAFIDLCNYYDNVKYIETNRYLFTIPLDFVSKYLNLIKNTDEKIGYTIDHFCR